MYWYFTRKCKKGIIGLGSMKMYYIYNMFTYGPAKHHSNFTMPIDHNFWVFRNRNWNFCKTDFHVSKHFVPQGPTGVIFVKANRFFEIEFLTVNKQQSTVCVDFGKTRSALVPYPLRILFGDFHTCIWNVPCSFRKKWEYCVLITFTLANTRKILLKQELLPKSIFSRFLLLLR